MIVQLTASDLAIIGTFVFAMIGIGQLFTFLYMHDESKANSDVYSIWMKFHGALTIVATGGACLGCFILYGYLK